MKRFVAIVLALILVLSLAACGAKDEPKVEQIPAAEPVELIVFAAASMTETLTEIGEKYMSENENVTLTFNFDSSGTLKTQIQEGADCDIFISAGQKQMNQLDISKATGDNPANTDNLDFVNTDTRFNILENKVALCVATNSNSGIASYDALAKKLQSGTVIMAMGNSDVPVGQYTQKILAYYELDEAALANSGCISYGTNVKEVTTQVSEGTVDCGVIYATDAFSAGLTVTDTAMAEMCGQVIYPAAVMKSCVELEAANAFMEYLKGAEASAIFEAVGFTPLAG